MALSFNLNDADKLFLKKQARLSIQSALDGDESVSPLTPTPKPQGQCAADSDNSALCKELGSFVTLNLHGDLRGCIGTIIGYEPLYLNVWHMARSAAFNDPRFAPLSHGEWPDIKMEISVLDSPSRCPDPEKIVIGRDGLILQLGGHSGVFLPQVPVEQNWNRQEYLDHLCIKAGLPIGSWKRPEARLLCYQALVFEA